MLTLSETLKTNGPECLGVAVEVWFVTGRMVWFSTGRKVSFEAGRKVSFAAARKRIS